MDDEMYKKVVDLIDPDRRSDSEYIIIHRDPGDDKAVLLSNMVNAEAIRSRLLSTARGLATMTDGDGKYLDA